MLLVLFMAAGLWGIGMAMGAPKSARWTMIGLLYLAVVGVQAVFPPEHQLVIATGGSLAMWLMIGGAVAVVLAYSSMLQKLRQKADAKAEDAAQENAAQELFSETELNRYARHRCCPMARLWCTPMTCAITSCCMCWAMRKAGPPGCAAQALTV